MGEFENIPKEIKEELFLLGLTEMNASFFRIEFELTAGGIELSAKRNEEIVKLLDIQDEINQFEKNIYPECEKIAQIVGDKLIELLKKHGVKDIDIHKSWPAEPTSFSVDFMNDITGEDEDLH